MSRIKAVLTKTILNCIVFYLMLPLAIIMQALNDTQTVVNSLVTGLVNLK
jgi:hypothetical protein